MFKPYINDINVGVKNPGIVFHMTRSTSFMHVREFMKYYYGPDLLRHVGRKPRPFYLALKVKLPGEHLR